MMMRLNNAVMTLAVALSAVVSQAFGVVRPGDQAPLFTVVDENLESFEMADFIDGTPLVFLYGSAT